MAIVLPFFVIPLALLLSLVLTVGGHYAHRSSEQVRLDALTLSLCHHRKNFIESSIVEKNEKIEEVQLAMDAVAIPCFAAMLSPAAPVVCEGVRSTLKALSQTGKFISRVQDLSRLKYIAKQQALLKKLIEGNELGPESGAIKTPTPFAAFDLDGFSREQTSAYRTAMETFFGTEWPQRLETNSMFASLHRLRSDFDPDRHLIGIKEDLKKWTGANPIRHKRLQSRMASSHSACSIIRESERKFSVKRIL